MFVGRGTSPGAPRILGVDAWWAAGAAVTALAAVTVFISIGEKSFWLDEGYSYAFAQSSWSQLWDIVSSSQANMGIYYGVLHGWLTSGDGESYVRSLSALFTIGTVPVVFLLGRRLVGPSAGVVAGLLLALNAFSVHYGQEARGYSLVMLLCALASLLFLRAMDSPAALRWTAYAVVMALAVYAHFFAGFVLIAHGLGWLSARKRAGITKPLVAFVAVGFLVAPLIVFVATNQGNQIGWIPEPTFDGLWTASKEFAGGGAVLLLAYLVAAGWGAVVAYRELGREQRYALVVLLGWLLIPILGSFGLSYAKPIFVTRYLIVALPPLILLAAFGIVRPPVTRLVAVPAAAVLVALSVASLSDWYSDPPQDDWRGAARFIETYTQPDSGLIVIPPKVRKPLEYYLARDPEAAGNAPHPIYPPEPLGTYPFKSAKLKPLHEELATRAENYQQTWVVLAYGSPAARRQALKTITQRFPLLQQAQFKNVAVLLFDTSSPVSN
jgi:mannosyltransferase